MKKKQPKESPKREKSSVSVTTLKTPSKEELKQESPEDILVRLHLKKLSSWFHTWHVWQRRLLVCSVMNCCTKQQLMVLATSLEPILHLDFSSSLLPPLQALHLSGVALFHIQRAITEKLAEPEELAKVSSGAYLDSLPSTFFSDTTTHLCKLVKEASSVGSLHYNESTCNFLLKRPLMEPDHRPPSRVDKKEPILPALPLTHPAHLPATATGLRREMSFTHLLGVRKQCFGSVPDFHSTTELLRKCGKKWRPGESRRARGRGRRAKTQSLCYYQDDAWKLKRKELFKEQLAQVVDVCLLLYCVGGKLLGFFSPSM